MFFYLCSYLDIFFLLAFLIIGSHIVYNSKLGLLSYYHEFILTSLAGFRISGLSILNVFCEEW